MFINKSQNTDEFHSKSREMNLMQPCLNLQAPLLMPPAQCLHCQSQLANFIAGKRKVVSRVTKNIIKSN